jgi:RNA polymerase sigma factor (sigma-70 family)
MPRGDPEARFNEQIRTLFQAGSLGALTDGQLLDRYASRDSEGSETAFSAIVERHGPMVLGVCRRLLCDAHLSEDAFQATFLVLARRAKSIRNRDSLGGWLHRVAHRIAMRLHDRFKHFQSRERRGAEDLAVKQPDHVESAELRAVIDQEIDRLGDAQRLPVVLCCLEGISHEEASQRLSWPVGTVKSRLARGRRRLQDRLVRRGLAPAGALAAGTALFGMEASAAVQPALIEATTKAAAAVATGGGLAGVVPAALSGLVQEELASMFATKMKLAAAATLTALTSVVVIGLAVAAGPSRKVETGPLVAAVTETSDEPRVKAADPRLATRISASGTVVDSNGKPVAAARVILREWSEYRVRGMPQPEIEKLLQGAEINDVLLEIKSDEAGRFRFQDVPAPAFPQVAEAGRSVFPWDIVVLAQGQGLAWAPLTLQNQRTPITLKVGPEGILHGRVVEPDGKPVAGAKVRVFGIDPLGRLNENGLGNDNRLNLNWSGFPLGVTTNREGRFTLPGLSRDKTVSLFVTEPRHERIFAYAATSDQAQPDLVSRTTRAGKSEENRMPIHTGEIVLTAKVADHVLSGRVVLEADGKAAAKAVVIHNGMVSKADEDGRFRIERLVAGTIELHASSADEVSQAAPVDIKIEIPETPREIEHTILLPRGLIVMGRVVDATNGKGVAKALVTFNPKYESNQTPTLFGSSKETDPGGRFRFVVPPGRGTLVLQRIPLEFPQPERRYLGQAEDTSFAREVAGRAGQTVEVAEFKLARGRRVVLRVVGAAGQPLAGARIDIRDPNRPFDSAPGHTDTEGRYPVAGISSDLSTVVDVIDAKESLGATIEIPDTDSGGANGSELEVRLEPLVSLAGRVLDDDGKPLGDAVVSLFRDVNYPGQSGRSFGVSIERQNEINKDGTYSFHRLIPGATYNTQVEVSGHPNATSSHVTVKAGESARLQDFRLPAVDQEVKGVVVDARGKPLAGVMVSFQRIGQTTALYAPAGGVWFQDTDQAGRFHLTALPRGAIKLMVYRRPQEADRQIRGIKYAEVRAGDTELRIELPDANDRLRGVE